jgi:hypothetical protein
LTAPIKVRGSRLAAARSTSSVIAVVAGQAENAAQHLPLRAMPALTS